MPFIGYELGTSTLDLSEEILSASGNSSETLSRSIGSDIEVLVYVADNLLHTCLLYTSPSPRDATLSRMPSSA